MSITSVAILGCGNIGSAVAKGLTRSGMNTSNITLTRRKVEQLAEYQDAGYQVTDDNASAVKNSQSIILSVAPGQVMDLLDDIGPHLGQNNLIISIVSGVTISELQFKVDKEIQIVRAMPNTAAVLGESMTCLSSLEEFDKGLKMRSMTFPDKFLDQDTPEEMYKKAGLDCNSIIEKIENVLKSNVIVAKNTIKKFP